LGGRRSDGCAPRSRSIVQKINADTVALLREPAVKARLEPLGVAGAGSTPAALAARAHADAELWGPVIDGASQ
jgi:tripartite-type tricarboxylate transporter receptor subunit TctC